MKENLTTQDICNIFDISKSTLFRWEGNLEYPKPKRDKNGNRKYDSRQILWIAAKQQERYEKELAKYYAKGSSKPKDVFESIEFERSILKLLLGNQVAIDEFKYYYERIDEARIERLSRITSLVFHPSDKFFYLMHKVIAKKGKILYNEKFKQQKGQSQAVLQQAGISRV